MRAARAARSMQPPQRGNVAIVFAGNWLCQILKSGIKSPEMYIDFVP